MTGEGWANGWYCTDCGRFLHKPPVMLEGRRYHSIHCKSPLRTATVSWSDR